MGVQDIIFTGSIDVTQYLGRMDCTILTSISEGQPLTLLEGFAAHLPAIATDVGNCRGLIYGEDDEFGEAGIITHVMNVTEIADAMVKLSTSPKLCEKMAEAGFERVNNKYTTELMKARYKNIYEVMVWGDDVWLESESD